MKFIKFYLTIILCCLLSANSYAEENPDLNPASSGGSSFVQSPRSDVDKFLKSKNHLIDVLDRNDINQILKKNNFNINNFKNIDFIPVLNKRYDYIIHAAA